MISERVQADFLEPAVLQDTSAYWVQELADQTPDGELPPWARVQEEIEHLLEQFLTLLTTPVVLSNAACRLQCSSNQPPSGAEAHADPLAAQ